MALYIWYTNKILIAKKKKIKIIQKTGRNQNSSLLFLVYSKANSVDFKYFLLF